MATKYIFDSDAQAAMAGLPRATNPRAQALQAAYNTALTISQRSGVADAKHGTAHTPGRQKTRRVARV